MRLQDRILPVIAEDREILFLVGGDESPSGHMNVELK